MSEKVSKKSKKDGVPKPDSESQESPNTTSINKAPTGEITHSPDLSFLPAWFGNTPHLRLLTLYEKMFEYKLGVKPEKTKINTPGSLAVRNLVVRFGEAFGALIIITHFDWKGVDGSDEFLAKQLLNNGYPLLWLPRNSTLYFAHIKNRLKITDETQAQKIISDVLTKITNTHA